MGTEILMAYYISMCELNAFKEKTIFYYKCPEHSAVHVGITAYLNIKMKSKTKPLTCTSVSLLQIVSYDVSTLVFICSA